MVKGKVTQFEIPVDKMDRARKFYADVFDWKIMAMPGPRPGVEYTMVFGAKTDAKGMTIELSAINGGIVPRGPR
jgi:predicted enzyme related to lactoylglutathione lyase